MNTKYLMVASAIFLSLIGLICSFVPEEILSYLHLEKQALFILIIQILGALYLGFAILNWTAKSNLIGGIYSKPVSLGNFLHFLAGGLAIAKYYLKHTTDDVLILPAIIYIIFAIAFGLVSFGRHEFKKQP